MIEALRASPCLSSNCAVAPCRAPPPHLLTASIAPHAARRLNRAEASHQPSLGRALALHPRSISLPRRFSAATVRALAHTFTHPHARSSVRTSVRPSVRSLCSLPRLRLLSFPRSFRALSPSRFLFPRLLSDPRTGEFARLLGRAPSSFAVSLAHLPPPVLMDAHTHTQSARERRGGCTVCTCECVRCAARCIVVCALLRCALCARPCPARRARGAARLGAPRRQVDDAMYVAQTVCNDDNRPTLSSLSNPDKFSWPAAAVGRYENDRVDISRRGGARMRFESFCREY